MNNLELEVRVHLRDDAARPVSNLTSILDRFGASAERLTKRARSLTKGLSGLAGAFREISAANASAGNAAASTGRLRGLIVNVGKDAKTASTGINSMSRATSRLATNAGKAADNVGKLRTTISTPLADGFLAQTNNEMRKPSLTLPSSPQLDHNPAHQAERRMRLWP